MHGIMCDKKNELVGWNRSTLPTVRKVPHKDWAHALYLFAATIPFRNCDILPLGTVLKGFMGHAAKHKLPNIDDLLDCVNLWLYLVFGLVCNVPVSADIRRYFE